MAKLLAFTLHCLSIIGVMALIIVVAVKYPIININNNIAILFLYGFILYPFPPISVYINPR